MPRPDISDQRRTEIVDAFADCVTELGLDAATLQRVADRAGVHKSIIRHYVGSRADLVTALVERALERYRSTSEAALAGAGDSAQARLDAFIDSLFIGEEPYEGALFIALMRPGADHAAAAEVVERHLEEGGALLAQLLCAVYEAASFSTIAVVAEGIGAMSLGASESMGATPATTERLRQASHRLAATVMTTDRV
ncbi:MAG: TetR family transcriptional regulator [Actinomycetota bacterium]